MAVNKQEYYRDKDGKISDKRLSPYGRKQLQLLDGSMLHFVDGSLTVKGDRLIDGKGKLVEKIDNDRLVNKIIFRVM